VHYIKEVLQTLEPFCYFSTVCLKRNSCNREHCDSGNTDHFAVTNEQYLYFRTICLRKDLGEERVLAFVTNKLFWACSEHILKSRDSSVGITLGYGLDDRCSRVRFPVGAGNVFLHRVQNGSGAHPASYPMGTRGSFPGNKAAGA
jgi:hypothetical protein